MDLTEAEDMKKRWQEYTEEQYKTGLNDSDGQDGVLTHLELDILSSEVKWALGSITMNKADGGDGIPAELFQILKYNAVKVLHSIGTQFSSVSDVSDSLQPHGLQHSRLPCPLPTPGVYSNSCPLS